MLFTQIEFILFLVAVLGALAIIRRNTWRKLLLLLASYYFYAYWDYRFLGLILASTMVDFFIGRLLPRTRSATRRKLLVATSLGFNLGMLGLFKYYDFFVSSLYPLLEPLGIHLGTLHLVVPVGISFYTFQTLSYTLDIHAGKLEPTNSLLDFALFVGFFPQLVAGPIVRASHFLPQLQSRVPLTRDNLAEGFRLFSFGIFKKVFLADRLALFVDTVFADAGGFDCPTTWLAALAYSLQIYFDFSGYSDMAIGVARAMGYHLPDNFNFPYLAKSVSDFWRRWHISLSEWIRDYLYIPLGGSRCGPLRNTGNLLASMILCGLWHGAGWTFAAWGGLHGAALVLHRMLPGGRFRMATRVLGMLVVVVGWVLFRSPTFEIAWTMLGQMFLPHGGIFWPHPFTLFVLMATMGFHVLAAWRGEERPVLPLAAWYAPAALMSLVWLAVVFYPTGFNPFIYFQF